MHRHIDMHVHILVHVVCSDTHKHRLHTTCVHMYVDTWMDRQMSRTHCIYILQSAFLKKLQLAF